MHSNNQIGTIQPIDEISVLTQKHKILLHSDAAQSVGKIPVDVKSSGIDMLSFTGHKFYGPKGAGALYIRSGVHIEKLLHGCPQEGNRRAGTENILGIVGIGKACEIAAQNMDKNTFAMKEMRDLLYEGLKARIKEIKLNGHPENRLPNILNISFKGITLDELCSKIQPYMSITPDKSYVLDAINLPEEWARCTIRFSFGKYTTKDEINKAIATLTGILKQKP